ncbi:hypothetical protein Moror_6088 [Moniliophthora roreri MCA 2997]|uniref:Uncharacterized protein n=1 Tax=Moniliophthora roreri (strain MCA 2997) TaxID=1381753 RepID=V2WWH9_MONRO|nr:hypothetical protein Moror_6088 [Moniliophthora roreri MCA 2997]
MLYLYWTIIFNTLTSFFFHSSANATPIPCFANSSITTLESLISCFDTFTVTEGFYSEETYAKAQPAPAESAAWIQAVRSMLNSASGDCTLITVPDILASSYTITPFLNQYCVLHELDSSEGVYIKGWGLMVVPLASTTLTLPNVHISTPHPIFDLHTPQQAAALFAGAGVRSLLVSGRIRTALLNQTDCIHPSGNGTVYYKTDPAHDDKEPFVVASKEIYRYQHAKGEGVFIQMHGKGASSCPQDTMFLSSGLGRSTSSLTWYTTSPGPTLPIRHLQQNLRTTFPEWNISLPTDSECDLTATTNVVGRYINGVEESRVCVEGATADSATGEFIHIEQAIVARGQEAYERWVNVLVETFGRGGS